MPGGSGVGSGSHVNCGGLWHDATLLPSVTRTHNKTNLPVRNCGVETEQDFSESNTLSVGFISA